MNISKKAMLVSLNISQWTARKFDKSATEETTTRYGAQTDSARVNKMLLPKDAIAKISKAANAIRTTHLKFTSPWSDNNQRILSGKNYFKFTDKMRELEAKFDAAVSELCTHYDRLVVEAKGRLNGLFRASDYPLSSELAGKFGVKLSFAPVPESGHLALDIGNEEVAKLQNSLEQEINQRVATAQADTWTRLFTVVENMQSRLADSDAVFRNTLVTNIQCLCNLLPGLNITDDPKLEKMRKEVEDNLLQYSPAELRENDTAREDTAKAAKNIMDKMAGYMGG